MPNDILQVSPGLTEPDEEGWMTVEQPAAEPEASEWMTPEEAARMAGAPAGAMTTEQVRDAMARGEDMRPIDLATGERIETTAPENLRTYIGRQRPRTDKSIWESTKGFLRSAVSPFVGRTQMQIDADAQALLSGDSNLTKDLFDESGNLTKRGEGAWNALGRGIDQLQGIGYGLSLLGSDLVGAEGLSEWLLRRWDQNQKQIQANAPVVQNLQAMWSGMPAGEGLLPSGQRARRLFTWGTEAVGENLPMMLPSIVTGGGAGMVARRVVAKGVEEAAGKKAFEFGARKAAELAAKRVAMAEAGGAFAGSVGLEAGAIYSDMVEQGTRGPVAALVALGAAVPAGFLDAIGPFLAIRRFGAAPITTPIEKLIRSTLGEAFLEKGIVRLGVAGIEGALTEGPTEYLQTAIEQAARMSQDPKIQGQFWEQFWYGYAAQMERREAAAKGAVAGGGVQVSARFLADRFRQAKKYADEKALDLGIRAALQKINEPVPTTVTTQGGIQITVPVTPVPTTGRTQPALPPVPGVEGAQLVGQALSLGLEQTARVVAGGTPQPIDLDSATQLPGLRVPQPQRTILTDAQMAELTREQGQAPVAPVAPAPIEVPAMPGPEPATAAQAAPAAQPTPAPGPQPAPAVGPAAAPAAPVVSPQPAVTPAAPGPVSAQAAPTVTTQRGLGLLTSVRRLFPHLAEIEVVDTPDQFPEAAKAEAIQRGHDLSAVDAIYHNGRVIFNASKFPTGNPTLVYQKVVHEAAIHLGLRRALGAQRFSRLVNDVWNNLSAQDRARIAQRNKIQVQDIGQIGEEWLAYEAERVVAENKTNPIWSKIASGIRAGLRRLGLHRVGVRFRLSDVEIANLVAKGLRAAQEPASRALGRGRTSITEVTRLSEGGQYAPPSPLATVDTIRFSFADVEQAKLEGQREYVPPTVGAEMEDAFKGVKTMLYAEARLLSDLIPPTTPWHQPRENQSLVEYLRQFYSPEGIELLKQTFNRDTAPDFVTDVDTWLNIKREWDAVESGRDPAILGREFLADNRKAGGVSWDFSLGTCIPTENCAVCYAKSVKDIAATTRARTRHSIVTSVFPNQVGRLIASYIKSQPKGDVAFLRINGAGDTTFAWQAEAVNTAIRNLDRPVHIFSRSHVSRADGTIGLDAIINGWFNPKDIQNGVSVYKMGSIDPQLMDEYGIEFLKDNLERRGIINCYLVKDANDIPRIQQLKAAGVFCVLHINATKETVKALVDSGIITSSKELVDNPDNPILACWCALETGPRINACGNCLLTGGPCFAMGSQLAMSERGQIVPLRKLLQGRTIPPAGKLVQMSVVGLPFDRDKIMVEVSAHAYDMAADILNQALGPSLNPESKNYGKTVRVENPIDRTTILIAKTKADLQNAQTIALSWKQMAAQMRSLANLAREGTGFARLYAEKQIEAVAAEERAKRDQMAAMDRAVQGVTRTSVSTGGTAVPEPVAQATPASVSPVAPIVPAGETEKVEIHDQEYPTRFSVTPLAVKNEDMQRVLAEAGVENPYEMLGKPDRELLEAVKQRMATQPSWIDSILDRERKKPGLLTDEETLALDYWMLQLRTMFEDEATKQEQAEKAGRPDFAAIHAANSTFWLKAIEELAEVTQRAGTEAGRAFRARQLALRWDFSLQSLINKKREAVGWRELDPEEIRELAATAKRVADISRRLEQIGERLSQQNVDQAIQTAKAEIEDVNPAVMQFAKEWVAERKRRAKSARDRFKAKWERLHPESPLRMSVEEGAAVPPLEDELMRELAIMGAAKLAENVTDPAEWTEAMVDDLGENIRPYLPAARQAADALFAQELATARTEMAARRAPRRVPKPAAPGAPAQPPPEPSVEDRIAVTKTKIGQAVEQRKRTAEPTKTAEDELYYPVQQLVRELIEQNPLITRDELINAVHEVLKESMPQITREETMDAISGRGRIRTPDPALVATTMRDLKAQIRISSHILDIKARRPRKRTGYQFDKPSDEQRHLMKQLNLLKREIGEVVTDPNSQLQSYLQSRKTWYRNRMADLRYEMAQRQLIARRDRAGQLDPNSPEVQELNALRAEYEQLREEHARIFARPELTPEQRLELAERAGERLIMKLERDLAEGRQTAGRRPDRLTSAKLEALRTRIIQLKAEQEWAQRHVAPPPDLTEPADFKRWFTLDRSIRAIENQLANEAPFAPGKPVRPVDKPSNQAMARRLEELKRERQAMRERLGPGKLDPLDQAVYSKLAQLRRQIADYNDRLARRDFEPRRRPEPLDLSDNPDVAKLTAERDRIVNDFYREVAQDRYDRLTGLEKIWQGIQATRRALVNLRSSFDFSAMRQALLGMASLTSRVVTQPIRMPLKIAKIFGQMFQATFSRTLADRINAAIRLRPNWRSGADRIGRIEYSDIESDKFTREEENARSVLDEWARLPLYRKGKPIRSALLLPAKLVSRGVAGSNRGFATFLNATRATLYDELLAVNFKDRPPTETELRVIGNYVNIATGRGKLNPATAKGLSQILWAPKLLMSRVQFLLGQPLWGGGELRGSARARMIVAKEYARLIVSGYLLAAVSSLFDEKKERSPLASDFGKIVRGNTRIDLWGGLQQVTVLMSRLAAGKTKTLKGREIDLTAAKKYGQGDIGMLISRFLRTKLRPDVGVALDILSRSDFRGEPLSVAGVLDDLFVPLPFSEISAIMRDRGFTEGMILEALNQFGAGVSVYEPSTQFAPRERKTK